MYRTLPEPRQANSPLNRFGFPCTVDFRGNDEEEAASERREAKLEPEWKALLRSWADHRPKTKVLRQMALKGIPNTVRGEAWQLLARSRELQVAHEPGTYQVLLHKESNSKRCIQVDVPRTWPNHSLFRENGPGQQALRNVLLAYSVYNPTVAYCGGMSWLPGLFLMYMAEEEAFWLFTRLCIDYNLEQVYAYCNAMGSKRSFYLLERLLPIFLPDLARHLHDEGVDIKIITSRWILTNCVFGLPFTAVVRFLDVFMVDGYDSVMVMCVALLSLFSDRLMELSFDRIILFCNELDKGEGLSVNKLMKRYAKLSAKVLSTVSVLSKQMLAELEQDGIALVRANRS